MRPPMRQSQKSNDHNHNLKHSRIASFSCSSPCRPHIVIPPLHHQRVFDSDMLPCTKRPTTRRSCPTRLCELDYRSYHWKNTNAIVVYGKRTIRSRRLADLSDKIQVLHQSLSNREGTWLSKPLQPEQHEFTSFENFRLTGS